MIPVCLRMRNFMCYRGDDNKLDLSGVHLACLTGDNGHGKSALLDAMTWALWGKSRARRDDELITLGETEMEVQLDFQLAENSYRVIRKRSRQGQGRSSLDLQIQQGDVYVPLSGDTIRTTQAQIISLLRMDYDTFINSAFLLQGRADEFTTKPPGERKRILGEILGLSLYEQYEEKAKELARTCAAEVQELTGALQQIQSILDKEPEYAAEVAQAEEEEGVLRRKLEKEEELLQSLLEKRRDLESKEHQLTQTRQRLSHARQERDTLKAQLLHTGTQLESYREALERHDEILAGFQELTEIRGRVAHLSDLQNRLMTLFQEKTALEQKAAAARHKLETQRQVLQAQITRLDQRVMQLPQAEVRLEEARIRLGSLNELQKMLETQRAELSQKTEEIARLSTVNKRLREEMNELRQKLVSLESAEAQCPLCGQALTDEHAVEIRNQYEASGKKKGDLWRANQQRIQQLQGEMQAGQKTIREAERQLRTQATWQRKLAQAEQVLAEAKEAGQTLEGIQSTVRKIEHQLAAGDYAAETRAELAKKEREIDELGYSSEEHSEARKQADELAPYEESFRKLQVAQEQLAAVENRLSQLQSACTRLDDTIAQEEKLASALEKKIAVLEPLVSTLPEKRRLVADIQAKASDARLRLGGARQRLDYCHNQAEEHKKKKALLDQRAEDQAVFEELRLAFGSRGLRAMIIESVLPEIEDEANQILARMTNGRMSVRFETQRETQRKTVIETLDIHISDELGTRDYQLYSGGEAFRIDFAIRVALSKLLARRAGARLQTLVIDEGFGTQDTQGRERLTEAINVIRDDFERVLVITHIEELKDLFPVRIDVTKTPSGSRLRVS